MRINAFIAQSTGIGRRKADTLIKAGRVLVDDKTAQIGIEVSLNNLITVDGVQVNLPRQNIILLLNKPVGYVVSRRGQGSKIIYDLLPKEYLNLKPIGRLDKDSSGLLLMSDDGQLAYSLTHPSQQKLKSYQVSLDKALLPEDIDRIAQGVKLQDGISRLDLLNLAGDHRSFRINMSEGRNRQIRRTFEALSYKVLRLHRTRFGDYFLKDLAPGQWLEYPSATSSKINIEGK